MVFTDNMKKESRLYLILMVVCAIIMIVFPVSFYFVAPETPLWQIIIVAIWFFVLFLLCLYAFLYSIFKKRTGK